MSLTLSEARRTKRAGVRAEALDEATERELLARVRRGPVTDEGRAAMRVLWMSHAGLVGAAAARFRQSGLDRDDLIAAGHLGLHTAIARFDASRFDSRLAAYASVWIRWHIQDYIRKNAGPVRLPESKAHRQLAQCGVRLMAEARRACEREGVEATDSELHARVGRRIGLPAEEVATGLRLIQSGRASLAVEDGDGETREIAVPDPAAPSADDMNERIDHERLRARLRVLANDVLGERERVVFLSRCMADNDDVPSLEGFAGMFGVSIARVHQIEASARRKISAALAKHGYPDDASGAAVAPFPQIRAGRAPSARRGADMREERRVKLASFAMAE